MKKIKILIFVFFLSVFNGILWGQNTDLKSDMIIKTDGTTISCKILKVTADNIEFQSKEKPFLIINRNDVISIVYGDGTVVRLKQNPSDNQPSNNESMTNPRTNNQDENIKPKIGFYDKDDKKVTSIPICADYLFIEDPMIMITNHWLKSGLTTVYYYEGNKKIPLLIQVKVTWTGSFKTRLLQNNNVHFTNMIVDIKLSEPNGSDETNLNDYHVVSTQDFPISNFDLGLTTLEGLNVSKDAPAIMDVATPQVLYKGVTIKASIRFGKSSYEAAERKASTMVDKIYSYITLE